MAGNIIIHNTGNISDQVSEALCHFSSGSLQLSVLIRDFFVKRLHVKERIDTFSAAKHIQSLICIQSVPKLRECSHCLCRTVHTIIDITLEGQLTVPDDCNAGSRIFHLNQNMSSFCILILYRMINTVTCVGDSCHCQSCILRKLTVSC